MKLIATFQGNVQGVGFRYNTHRIASDFQITGFVRNQPDGSVRLVAEGDEREIKAFLKKVQEHFAENIDTMDAKWTSEEAEHKTFSIQY